MEPEMILLGIVVILVFVIGGIYVMGFKNWLVWAVTEAESMFGGGTGQLKLRHAYDLAVRTYPAIAKLIPFSLFKWMVDKALDIMREMIEKNAKIAGVIVGVEPTEGSTE